MANPAAASALSPAEPTSRDAMRALFDRIARECDLPPLPAVAVRAMKMVRDPDTKATDLARLVSTDAAIAARVLRISRSVLYARREPPKTLQDAISTVGFQALRKILVAASARTAYRAGDDVAHRLWEHALATAFAADELAVAAGGRRGGSAFITGLLHDVGRLVFHLSSPAACARLPEHDPALETELFGAPHAAIGACLAEQWELEDEVVEAIMFHHRPDVAAVSTLAGHVCQADTIACELGYAAVAAAPVPPESRSTTAIRVADILASERTLFE